MPLSKRPRSARAATDPASGPLLDAVAEGADLGAFPQITLIARGYYLPIRPYLPSCENSEQAAPYSTSIR